MFAAALGGGELIVKLLLEWGANVTQADEKGWTALQNAPQNGYEPTVQLLLEWGANVRVAQCEWRDGSPQHDGRTRFDCAAAFGQRRRRVPLRIKTEIQHYPQRRLVE